MSDLSNWWTERKLKRRLQTMRKGCAEKYEKLKKDDPQAAYDYAALQADEYFEEKMMEEERNGHFSNLLLEQARDCDVEVPPISNKELWQYTEDGEHAYLTLKGRDLMRDRINEAKERSSADWARRSKIIVPIIAAFAALFGAATGLVLAFKK
jgi:hypothetical protein